MPNTLSDLADNIRAEVARRGMTHEATALAAGMSPSTYHRRLDNPGAFRVWELDRLAAVLHCALTIQLKPIPFERGERSSR